MRARCDDAVLADERVMTRRQTSRRNSGSLEATYRCTHARWRASVHSIELASRSLPPSIRHPAPLPVPRHVPITDTVCDRLST